MSELFQIANLDPEVLDAERRRVLAALSSCLASEQVHEVGSTAIPGVVGKQDLDFLVRVPASDFISTRATLDQQFTRDPDQLANSVYQGYKVESELDVAIQLTVEGGPHDTFLSFVDRLRDSALLRVEYNKLKLSFNGRPMAEYRAAKQAFIERVLSEAANK